MAQQHVFTSAPQGLKPGTRGFTTVGASRDLTPTFVSRLELLSGYTLPAAPAADAKAKFTPVNFMHVKLTVNGEKHTVVSRVAPTGVDYTGRSNTLAHHLVISKKEEPPAGPAWLAMHSGLLINQWTGQPRQLPSMQLPPGMAPGKPCETWAKVMGDATYAGSLVAAIVNQPGRPIVLIHTPEQAPGIPEMLFEAMSILPQTLRWDVTFSTYFTSAAPDVHCRVRCILSTDPLADQVRRVASVVLLDLTQKTNGRPIAGEPFETCKKGGTWPNLNPTSDASEETSDRVHPAAAKMLRAKAVPQLEDLILAELPDDPSGVHPPVLAPPPQAIARNRANRKDDMATYKAMALAAAAVIGSVSVATFGAFYLFSSSSSTPPPVPLPLDAHPEPRPPVTIVDNGSIVPSVPSPAPSVPPPGGSPATPPGSLSVPPPRLSVSTSASLTGPASGSGATDSSTPGAGSTGFASKQLVPLQWAEFKIYDEGNSLFRKYQNAAAGILPNLIQPLSHDSNTLIARFPEPLPKGLTETSSFEVVINLPVSRREFQASINGRNPTIAEVRRISTDVLTDATGLFSLSIEKQKDNKLMQLRIEPGAMPLEDLVGVSILIQPPTDNFAAKPEGKDRPVLVAYLSDPAARTMTFEIPVHMQDMEKSATSLNSAQASQFGRLKQWYLSPATPQTLPAGRWSDSLLTLKQKPNASELPAEGAFIPVIMLSTINNPVPLFDLVVRPSASATPRSFWDLRGEAGRKKIASDIAKSSLKETVDAINTLGSSEDERFHRILANVSASDIAKDLEADGRRVSTGIPVSPKLGSLLAKAKEDARSATTLEKEYTAALAAFKSATESISTATYEGYDVFGNVSATATFNIEKTGQTIAPIGPRTSITAPAPGSGTPPSATTP